MFTIITTFNGIAVCSESLTKIIKRFRSEVQYFTMFSGADCGPARENIEEFVLDVMAKMEEEPEAYWVIDKIIMETYEDETQLCVYIKC